MFGWKGDTEIATGYLSYQVIMTTIGSGTGRSDKCIYTAYTGWVYHDSLGASHPFWGSTQLNNLPSNCGPNVSSTTLASEDGSGYTLNLSSYTDGTVSSPDGKKIAVPNVDNGPATFTDPNGNQISVSGTGTFTDTTGNVALTVAGTAPNPHTFTYYGIGGGPQQVSMNYQTYTVQTAFGCSGIVEYGPVSTSMVNSITLPDGSAYNFTYEATPNGSGNITGRLASVTLPTGGTITYTYSGGNEGIECADGSAAGLTRSVSADSGSSTSTSTYARSGSTSSSSTNYMDGLGNYSVYNFVQASNQETNNSATTAVLYETSRSVYQGAATGTPILSRQTCTTERHPHAPLLPSHCRSSRLIRMRL
jgi:hypothetical protein